MDQVNFMKMMMNLEKILLVVEENEESASKVDLKVVEEEGKIDFQEITSQYPLDQVYNADELGLYFRMMP